MRLQHTVQAIGEATPIGPQTGEHCPTTGWWVVQGSGRPRFIAEGDVMPPFDGRPVTWAKQHTSDSPPRKVAPMHEPPPVDQSAFSFGPQGGAVPSPNPGGCDDRCLFCSLPETD